MARQEPLSLSKRLCKRCGKPLTKYQRVYCSKRCSCIANNESGATRRRERDPDVMARMAVLALTDGQRQELRRLLGGKLFERELEED